ncbi:hypothetical protein KI688_007258 [Linnemannia hyalina]|uniref:C3H1-type domain-containing protein n=1 Tax=Linnemannia hyalina TaxID=64524 RepID=A0A9P8BQ80_9FUNG|nr:hypothetical protein KI688_007258 [Linnemannia hyalina]
MSTRPCMFFLAGTCRNGTDCRFYHEGFSGIPRNVLTGDSGMSVSTTAQLNGTTTTTSAPAAVGGRSNSRTSPTSPLSASSSSASAAQTPTSSSSSASSSNTRPAYAASRPCNWYMAGYCLRGDNCWFSHDRAVIEGRSRGNGGREDGMTTSPGEVNGELTSSTADATAASARNNSNSGEDDNEDHKCAICLEVPSTFGLLGNTLQPALSSLLPLSKNIEQDIRSSVQDRTSVTKACPNCRTQSLFIVPSSYFPSTPEQKEAIIQNYKVVSARRTCKYFKDSGERHWCPFGDDCFFAHLDARGEPCKVNLLSNPRLNRRRDRYGIGGSRSLFHRRGFEGFGGYSDNYGNERYRSAARQRVHREMIEDLAFIQMSTSNVTHNHLEQIQGLLARLARLGVDDLNFNPHDHTHVRAITEAFEEYVPSDLLEVDPESYYDEDDDDNDYVDEDDFEDEDVDEDDDDEDVDSETTLERDEREAYEEFGDDLYFQTYFLSPSTTAPRSNTAVASDPMSDYDIDAYHDSVWAEYDDY